MKTQIYNQKAEVIGELELNAKLFGVKPNAHIVAQAVRVIQLGARQGGAHTKTRGDVRGGGKKPWKQKGTGRARAGSIRSPLWRGGGVTFGPRSNRNWERKMNKQERKLALASVLSDKLTAGRIFVLDAVNLTAPKTREFVQVLNAFAKTENFGKKHLLLLPLNNQDLTRASRNLPSVNPVVASTLNVVQALNADDIIILKEAVTLLDQTFARSTVEK